MKRKFTYFAVALVLLTFLAIPIGMRGQTRDVETFTFSELGYSNGDDVTTVEGDNVTLTFAQGEGNNPPKYYTSGTGVRMYTNNTLEVALNNQEGETRITAIDFTFSGTYTGSLQNWTGSETSVSFTNTASGQARIQVIAVTFSEGGVAPTTYTVTYNANVAGVAPVVDTYVEGANVTLRDANTFTNDGYTFSEWNTQADGDGDPFDAGDVIENIQDNIELYAIWTGNIPSDEQWVLTNLADLTETDVFVIVGNNGSNYAMSNDNGTGSAPATVAVTITGNVITSTVAANIQWTVSGDATNGYTFYPNGSTETWLYCNTTASSSSNNNMRVGTGERNVFELNSSNYLLTKDNHTTRYLSIYSNQDWRGYINTNLCPELSFYKKVTGGVLPPSISAENVSIEYNATSGSIAYTINNGVEGGAVSAVVTDGDWLTLGQGTTSPISFTCSANEAATERTATVTLTYTYNRTTATANITVTQAGNPNVTPTIAEVRAQGTGAVVTKGIVTSITGSNNKTAYIQDATAAIVVYGDFTAAVGDEIRVSGTLQTYNGLLEITSPQVTVISTGNTINPQLMTVAEVVASTNQGWYIRIENATVTEINGQNTTIAQGNNTIVVRGISGVEYEVNDVLSLNGNIGRYNNVNQIANPQNVEVQQGPSITITPATVDVGATGVNGVHIETLTLTYDNIVVENYQSFTVQHYNAEGEPQQQPTWIVVGVTGTNDEGYTVRCVVLDNAGDARTAYFKVSALDEENNVIYSNLVTINQAEYVAPTYATLPFTFDGGKADIDTIDGFYQEGLDSDYGSSPKLKFNTTGDYVLLQFNERPGLLTFDIKGNSFSGGTFTVQASEDGATYTDLKTYNDTNLGNSVLHESIEYLGDNVRYIKWIYTEKVNGNVALGNIVLNFPQPIVLDTYEIEMPAEGGEGTINVTYWGLGTPLVNDFISVDFFAEDGETSATYDWITAEPDANHNIHYLVLANQGEARTAYFKVVYSGDNEELKGYVTGGEYSGGVSDLVTVTQAAYVAPTYAALPFTFDGGRADIENTDGLYQEGLDTDYSSSPKLKFKETGTYVLLQFNEEPGTLTFDIKGNSFSGGTFTVQTSEDGVTYTDLETYTELSATQHELFDNLGENVRYIKWIYTEKVSGNVALGNITLAQPAAMYSLTVEPFENLEIFTFIGGDESEMALEGAGTIQVAEGDQVMLSISANEGYEIQSLMVDGVEHVNDIADDMTYTFNMPNHNVTISATAVAVVPFEPATYTLVTSYQQLEMGKPYIIVGSKTIEGETYYYAMGEQRTYNRAGVAISVEDGVAQVNSPEVHEFIIDDFFGDDLLSRGFITGGEGRECFIYDTDETSSGYLYAASSTANQLKTKDTLDWNCDWEIVIDSTGFSIHGRYGFTHNVMQFNYNNNNPAIFSCYETASQSPVYLYVKDETPSVVTQTIALATGVNWVSFNAEITLDDLKAALVATGNTTIEIKSKLNGSTTYNGSRWRGTLNTLDVAQMYRVKVGSDCEIVLEGMPVEPAEHPVTINPGANWIAFPLDMNMTVANAFAGFAVNGDNVKAKLDGSTTYNGSRWRGTLSNLVPGQGYVYTSAASESRIFVFPAPSKQTK